MLKYIGKGFIPDIPTRDLTDEEVRKYGGEADLLKSGLYQRGGVQTPVVKEKKMKGKKHVWN